MIYSSAIKNVGWGVAIPHEINNQFLGRIQRLSIEGKIPYDLSLVGLYDFGDVKIDILEINKYIDQLNCLKKILMIFVSTKLCQSQFGGLMKECTQTLYCQKT